MIKPKSKVEDELTAMNDKTGQPLKQCGYPRGAVIIEYAENWSTDRMSIDFIRMCTYCNEADRLVVYRALTERTVKYGKR